MTLDSQGRIFVLGYEIIESSTTVSDGTVTLPMIFSMALTGYTATGELDTSFGDAGIITFHVGENTFDLPVALAVDEEDHSVLCFWV